ncbi:MAG: DNA-directed RNA polymerase subunit A' [Candidatus Thermoplasmatota archaeon]|nr:DNA-directed RNA polymerase subunit A' [Candidatus Thermoplasmatota archaeon]
MNQSKGISKRIGSIQFAYMSPEEKRDLSATKIITPDTYDDDGFPIEMGLMDAHLGVIEPGLRCKTCGGRVDECSGHFGHIELAMPVIHIGYVKEIKKLLRSTCSECGRILLEEEKTTEYLDRMEEMREMGGSPLDIRNLAKEISKDARKKGRCPHCNTDQPKIKLDKPTTFREENTKLTPKEVRARLERIPDNDLWALGINPDVTRPEYMVLKVLLVPPVTVRPSITLESGDRSEDDLTHKLVDILRINQRLRENRDVGSPQLIVEDLWDLLQYHATTYFDNQTSGIPPARHRSGRTLKTLIQRLKGKEGRFRQNLSGKRVNFSARTVISPDPWLSINEVGVPERASRELTVPLKVTPMNLDYAKELIKRGPSPSTEDGEYLPGVNYMIRPDGRRIKVTETNAEAVAEKAEPGFTLERELKDGDIVLFNRQPSLHRMSMMAHEVKVVPGKTFRLNLAVCPPYNADFDGDEMNLHVLQSEEARAEAKVLMRVQEHILSPRFGGPIIGAIQDHISGLFFLTYDNPTFTREEVVSIFSNLETDRFPEPVEEDGNKIWKGKDIFSYFLPDDLNMEFKASICQKCETCDKEECQNDAYVKIEDGQLEHGTIDENAVSAFAGEVVDKIARDYGTDAGRKFIDQITTIALAVITLRGFTTTIEDEEIPDKAENQIESVLTDAENKVRNLIEAYKDGELEELPGRGQKETLEVKVMKELGKARDDAGKIASKHLGLSNNAVVMARTGARASMLNLTQMAGALGQQAIRGERPSRGYEERTLSHFKRKELGAESRGFVRSSYKDGLNPVEYFFHSMGGREGLVDTAVRTARSGYMQRRLINALEDLMVADDGTVRNTADKVIQFDYGEDGIDPMRSKRGDAVNMDDVIREFKKRGE